MRGVFELVFSELEEHFTFNVSAVCWRPLKQNMQICYVQVLYLPQIVLIYLSYH